MRALQARRILDWLLDIPGEYRLLVQIVFFAAFVGGVIVGVLVLSPPLFAVSGGECVDGQITYYTSGVVCAPFARAYTDLGGAWVVLTSFSPHRCRCYPMPVGTELFKEE